MNRRIPSLDDYIKENSIYEYTLGIKTEPHYPIYITMHYYTNDQDRKYAYVWEDKDDANKDARTSSGPHIVTAHKITSFDDIEKLRKTYNLKNLFKTEDSVFADVIQKGKTR
ncbi:MAG: hypothetical protein WC979_01415 [Candidatus Pacearchaeota archaeon]|jgi:hypothetical protein|nr:hypothetical protein [Clostridia bacterium]